MKRNTLQLHETGKEITLKKNLNFMINLSKNTL